MSEKIRIKEVRGSGGRGFGVSEYRVIEWPKDEPLPDNAQVVPDDTPLTDWTEGR